MFAPLHRVDWQSFLARPTFQPRPEVLSAVVDLPILITGAGGSIGSVLALHLAGLGASRLLLLDASENHLHHLQQQLATTSARARARLILADAGDAVLLDTLFTVHQPRIVFHAAAYKHVPILEQQPLAAIANNVFVTESIASTAAQHDACLVLLSTDKAVQPASIMGATKHIAERIVLAAGGTALRLGNVLASSGSVAEVFAQQAIQGGPLTITHPAARRFFLTLNEAANLLLAAAHIATTSTSSALLAPALSTDHGIVDLARFLANSFAPGRDLPLTCIGLRPGERLFEKLWCEDELAYPATDGLLTLHSASLQSFQPSQHLAALHHAHSKRDPVASLAALHAQVPDLPSDISEAAPTSHYAQWTYA